MENFCINFTILGTWTKYSDNFFFDDKVNFMTCHLLSRLDASLLAQQLAECPQQLARVDPRHPAAPYIPNTGFKLCKNITLYKGTKYNEILSHRYYAKQII